MKLRFYAPEATFSKGLFLVYSVLIPQIVFLLVCFAIGKSQEDLLQKAKNAFWFSVQINETASAQLVACGYQTLYVLIGAQADERAANQYKNRAIDSLDKIRKDPQRDLSKAKIYEDFEHQAEERFQQFFEMKSINAYTDMLNAKGPLKAFRKFANMTLNRDRMFQKGMSDHVSGISDALDESIRFRTFMNYLILVGLFANLGIAICIISLFSKSIISKLRILIENATLLAEKKTLNREVPGTDELAYVDKVFHRVSQELIAADEFKNNLLSMVAHDMCSPLAAVNLSLSIVEGTEQDKLSQQSKEAMSQASADVDLLVSHAREVLDVQRLSTSGSGSSDEDLENIASTEKLKELSRLVRIDNSMLAGAGDQKSNLLKPSLVVRSYVLFLSPLIVSMVFLALILAANISALQAFETDRQQSSLALDINKVITSDFLGSSLLVKYLMYGDESDKEKFFSLQAKEIEKANSLHASFADQESMTKFQNALDRLKDLQQLEIAVARKMTPALLDKGEVPDLRAIRTIAVALRCMVQKQSTFLEMTESQHDSYREVSSAAEQRKSYTLNILLWGIVIDLLAALLAAFVFSRSITRRLAVVTDNAARLSSHGVLSEPLSGNDELYFLDSAIHQTSDALQRALKQRVLLMETVAEDLRVPLTKIDSALTIIDEDAATAFAEKGQKHFSSAKNNIKRILLLIDTLIAVENLNAQTLAIEKTSFAASDATTRAVDSIAALAASRQIKLHPDVTNIIVCADFNRIVQVLVNYLTNAINHTPEGGEIWIRVSTESRETPFVIFAVEDTGPGLAPELREKVFDRFYQTDDSKSKKKGYGMGLAICKMITEAHGGAVGVREASTGGCSFYIELPAS